MEACPPVKGADPDDALREDGLGEPLELVKARNFLTRHYPKARFVAWPRLRDSLP